MKLKYNKKKKGEYLNKIKNLCKKNAEKEEELSKYMKYKGNKYYYVSDLIKKELEEKE